jgi:hypothetical protein
VRSACCLRFCGVYAPTTAVGFSPRVPARAATQAWLLATLEEGPRRAHYVLLAALYAAPYVRCAAGASDGVVDTLALLSVGAGVLHLQLERRRSAGLASPLLTLPPSLATLLSTT